MSMQHLYRDLFGDPIPTGSRSTDEGLSCGDVCKSVIYSDDAMSWRRSIDQLEGASFVISRKIGSEFRVNCRLVDRAGG